jgi:hypothetical protein
MNATKIGIMTTVKRAVAHTRMPIAAQTTTNRHAHRAPTSRNRGTVDALAAGAMPVLLMALGYPLAYRVNRAARLDHDTSTATWRLVSTPAALG